MKNNKFRFHSIRFFGRIIFFIFLFGACASYDPFPAQAASDIINTKHNLSVSGTGTIRASSETRICVFCHTPHNATSDTPLWNKEIQAQTYTLYTRVGLRADPLPQPFGPTKLCLSCHDGTIAIGAVVNPSGGITMVSGGPIPPGSLSNFGLNLSNHHPVSFPYSSSFPNPELVSTPPADLVFGGGDSELHCTTCHNPHDDTNGMFLAVDHRYSALCIKCHQMSGWNTSSHATSGASAAGVLPISPKIWPMWSTVAEWGCEICHTPHSSKTSELLLNYTSSDYCLSCHSPVPVPVPPPSPPIHGESVTGKSITSKATTIPMRNMADIKGQMKKISGHHEQPGVVGVGLRSAKAASRSVTSSVTCSDCHNPHASNKGKASAPFASGMLQGVSGVDRNGMEVPSVTNEYELCFKCHGDYSMITPYIPRVINTTNMRLAFDPSNPSYHPIVSMGKVPTIPSIPSPYEPKLRASDIIYCTDCHRDDAGGSKGPHGSSFAPILRERYETTDGTPESYQNYALCYRCHNRTSILSDTSFRKKVRRTTAMGGGHSGHLAAGAPCSACHDPHGVNVTSLMASPGTESHSHLINFDMTIAMPKPGSKTPVFTETGIFSGSCTLVCHGRVHTGESYP